MNSWRRGRLPLVEMASAVSLSPCIPRFPHLLINSNQETITASNSLSFRRFPLSFHSVDAKSLPGRSKSLITHTQHGFRPLPLNSCGFVFKIRPCGVQAMAATGKNIYDFTAKDAEGKDVSLTKFKGKVILIVNVASKCGLTTSNYSELSHMYEKFKNQGFEVLAFPCNQFGGQEGGTNEEIKKFARMKFKAEFPIFGKVEVNGPGTSPLYEFLKSSAGGGFLGNMVKWNFEKFLVDRNGKVFDRYPPTTSPFRIQKDIIKLLTA